MLYHFLPFTGGYTDSCTTQIYQSSDFDPAVPGPADREIADDAPDIGNIGPTTLQQQLFWIDSEVAANSFDDRLDFHGLGEMRFKFHVSRDGRRDERYIKTNLFCFPVASLPETDFSDCPLRTFISDQCAQ